jgi:hypothetical protein
VAVGVGLEVYVLVGVLDAVGDGVRVYVEVGVPVLVAVRLGVIDSAAAVSAAAADRVLDSEQALRHIIATEAKRNKLDRMVYDLAVFMINIE